MILPGVLTKSIGCFQILGEARSLMTVNPDVGLSAPDTLHPEGLYAFRFDLNGDAREEVTFKFRFGEPRHGDSSEHTHIQPFVVRKAESAQTVRQRTLGL